MKKIFLTLSIALLGFTKGFSQLADLQAFVAFDTTAWFAGDYFTDTVDHTWSVARDLYVGDNFTPTYAYNNGGATTDSIWGVWGTINNGPDAIDAGKSLAFINSLSRFLTYQECIDNNVTCNDTSRYFWTYLSAPSTSATDAGNFQQISSYQKVDSVRLLMDWDLWVDSGRVKYLGQPYESYVNGKAYGFFVRAYGIGSTSAPENIDNVPANNRYVHKVIWNTNNPGTNGIADMLVKRNVEAITVYPNPTNSEINFTYNFKQNSVGDLVIKDMTGRVLRVQNYGRQAAGEHSYKYDISSLPAGNYIAEFQTGEAVAISKFVKN